MEITIHIKADCDDGLIFGAQLMNTAMQNSKDVRNKLIQFSISTPNINLKETYEIKEA